MNLAAGERIIAALQRQQFVWPHQGVGDALEGARRQTGFCPQAAEQALAALAMDRLRQVGRLKRCELAQLARAIERFWSRASRQAAESPVA
jgi:hypothetical protein